MRALVAADRSAAPSSPAMEPELFLQTVPRTLVHRAAVSEVLLTGIRQVGEDSFQLGAQWPRGHSYYGPVDRRWHDPMLLAETIRQAVLLISHDPLEIPLGHSFLSHSTSYEVIPEGAVLVNRPAHILLEARLRNVARRAGSVGGFDVEFACHRDERYIGRGHMSLKCVPASTYRRLRGERADAVPTRTLPEPVAPELVGRRNEADVVLGATTVERVWTLRADPDHPVLFDHPVDHIPGMVVMEGARQAALAALGRPDGLAVGCSVAFDRFVEFGSPCLVTAEPGTRDRRGPHRVSVRFDQGGVTVASCDVTVHTAA